ncbi:hypothetical protein EVAR_76957_1 [Eumeta japonica]|uniref:Uncharacterized protein n=1 Tax=Eumeta variegata TaxID=151549 RepID=A0A4C1SHQ3_EUMVA|nr:hypothetical protein EVAR_76957_1 [Eumeta japonica]
MPALFGYCVVAFIGHGQVCAEPHRVKCIATSYTSSAGRRDRPRCAVAPSAVHASDTAARRSVAAYRTAFRVPRGPLPSFCYTTRPARCAVVASRNPTWRCGSV